MATTASCAPCRSTWGRRWPQVGAEAKRSRPRSKPSQAALARQLQHAHCRSIGGARRGPPRGPRSRLVSSLTCCASSRRWRRRPVSFLEWGTAYRPLLLADVAASRGGRVVTIDNDAESRGRSCGRLPAGAHVESFVADLTGSKLSSRTRVNYGTLPLALATPSTSSLIDGRRRLECLLTASPSLAPQTIVRCTTTGATATGWLPSCFQIAGGGAAIHVLPGATGAPGPHGGRPAPRERFPRAGLLSPTSPSAASKGAE